MKQAHPQEAQSQPAPAHEAIKLGQSIPLLQRVSTQHTLLATDAHTSFFSFWWWLGDVIESRFVLLSCPGVEKVTIWKRGDKSNFSEGKIVIYRVVWGTGMLQALSAITVTAVLPSSLPPAQPSNCSIIKAPWRWRWKFSAQITAALWLLIDLNNETSQSKLGKHL